MPNLDLYNIPVTDQKTFDLLGEGITAGIFQLENKSLGGRYSSHLKPKNIEEIAAIIALIRPGSLNSKMSDGKSVTDHYEMRHLGQEVSTPIIKEVGELLKDTHDLMIFQEQTLIIAKQLAGFDGSMAMKLQKGISKKKAEIINELRPKFVDGCMKNGISEKDAVYLYDIIEASNRYSFNKSHSIGYSYISYEDAYFKANFPIEFFIATLRMNDDFDYIRKIVEDCAKLGIRVKPPTIEKPCITFTEFNDQIYYGFSNIKGIGEAKAQELINTFPEPPKTWYECLCRISSLGKTLVQNSIKAGVFSYLKVPKRKMMDDFSNLQLLSGGEMKFVTENWPKYSDFDQLFAGVLGICQKKRRTQVQSIHELILKPAETLEDNIDDIIKNQVELLGVPLSYDVIDTVSRVGNATIEDYLTGYVKKEFRIVAQIEAVKVITVKKGKNEGRNMAFLNIKDQTGKMEAVIFSDAYDEYGGFLKEGTVQTLVGVRGKQFIINEIEMRGGF